MNCNCICINKSWLQIILFILIGNSDSIWLCNQFLYRKVCYTLQQNFGRHMFYMEALEYDRSRIWSSYDTELIWLFGLPICVITLSSHWRGPFRWISIQHGVEVTSWRWYSAPQPSKVTVSVYYNCSHLPFTKDIRIVHILVNSNTLSYPKLTDCESNWANSWLLNILSEQPGGILQTVDRWNPWW